MNKLEEFLQVYVGSISPLATLGTLVFVISSQLFDKGFSILPRDIKAKNFIILWVLTFVL